MDWLTKLLGRHNDYMTLSALADRTGISLGTLRMAVHESRLEAKKSGHTWLSTEQAVERAIALHRLKRK